MSNRSVHKVIDRNRTYPSRITNIIEKSVLSAHQRRAASKEKVFPLSEIR